MAETHVHVHLHLDDIYGRIEALMSQLSEAVAGVRSALDTEVTQIHGKLDELQAALQAALDLDANPEVQQAVSDLRGITDNLTSVIPDVPDEPPAPDTPPGPEPTP